MGKQLKTKGKSSKKKKQAAQPVVRLKFARKAKQVRAEIKPIKDCDVAKAIKKRPDRALLQKHLDDISVYSQTYEARLKLEPDVSAHKAKITEAKGERAATLLMIEKYVAAVGKGNYQILWTFTPGTGIDQLWYAGPPFDTYVIVEAKGPGATLSTTSTKGDQMSKMWVRKSLEEVIFSAKSTPDEINHAKRMIWAMNNGRPPEVLGTVIEANPDGSAKQVYCPDKGIYHKTN
jgi:hypothetical protein